MSSYFVGIIGILAVLFLPYLIWEVGRKIPRGHKAHLGAEHGLPSMQGRTWRVDPSEGV